jgi:hypothetical protein
MLAEVRGGAAPPPPAPLPAPQLPLLLPRSPASSPLPPLPPQPPLLLSLSLLSSAAPSHSAQRCGGAPARLAAHIRQGTGVFGGGPAALAFLPAPAPALAGPPPQNVKRPTRDPGLPPLQSRIWCVGTGVLQATGAGSRWFGLVWVGGAGTGLVFSDYLGGGCSVAAAARRGRRGEVGCSGPGLQQPREQGGGGQTVGNSEKTALTEIGLRCVLDGSCPLSSAGGGDFFGASGWAQQPSPGAAQRGARRGGGVRPPRPSDFCAVAGRERASGPTRRAKWAKIWFTLGHSGPRDLVKTRR